MEYLLSISTYTKIQHRQNLTTMKSPHTIVLPSKGPKLQCMSKLLTTQTSKSSLLEMHQLLTELPMKKLQNLSMDAIHR